LGLILASGGGIGGGGMLVPLYVLVMVRRRAPLAGFTRSTDTRLQPGLAAGAPFLQLAVSLSPIVFKANTTTPCTPVRACVTFFLPPLSKGFSPKHAIPLSNVTVFGGSLANHMVNRSKRHPSADRPLVDYDLILVMQPMTIAGALLG
jgi:uncharacterized membrane protein YfcA